ncbi:helix-turn-helix domain-containing protein [Nonomuraea sp. MG754425]|uniref:helix-turn-helix domain-containing protein n=1 Tax=Nonomuraea sp. MG754425 TaxID=2570319 RepID=UPI001F3CD061|nr:helix-turn-helix transcriptional regulator [Nonomuraea sp. MG754425]MCF6473265.1 helix-turn-helix domain-containing protein [Nonomuraea sp. MG754425]
MPRRTTSTSSDRNLFVANPQHAREALGHRLRELRQNARLTGYELAEQLGWQQPKVSKIENGRQTPSRDDVLGWTRITGAAEHAPDLIATLTNLETMYAEWRRQLRAGMRGRQESINELEDRTTLIRVFENVFVPGLLQTSEYARSLLEESAEFYEVPDDVEETIQARLRRQEVLYQGRKRFHIVVAEAVLRYRFCPVEDMIAQLDRLMTLSALRNVHFGVIPFDVRPRLSAPHGFWIYDERVVLVETIAAELTLTQPQEIALYGKAFNWLAGSALYGMEARRLITGAADDLASQGS